MYYFITMLSFVLFCYYTLEYVETHIQDVVIHTSEHELCVSWCKRVLVEISFTCGCEWVFLAVSLCS
jgi:hypothetical protein